MLATLWKCQQAYDIFDVITNNTFHKISIPPLLYDAAIDKGKRFKCVMAYFSTRKKLCFDDNNLEKPGEFLEQSAF